MVKKIQEKVGHTGSITLMNWSAAYKRALEEANIGLFSTTRTPEREDLFHWVGPLARNDWVLFALKKNDISLATLTDAKGFRIGTYKDDATDLYLRANGLEGSLKTTSDDRLNAQKLAMGVIDLWAGGAEQVPFKCRQVGVDPERIEEVLRFQSTHLYLAISKQTDPMVAQAWQTALDELREKGVLAPIEGLGTPHPE